MDSNMKKDRYKIMNLKDNSEFYGTDSHKLNRMRITNYNPEIMKKHHSPLKHEYYMGFTEAEAVKLFANV